MQLISNILGKKTRLITVSILIVLNFSCNNSADNQVGASQSESLDTAGSRGRDEQQNETRGVETADEEERKHIDSLIADYEQEYRQPDKFQNLDEDENPDNYKIFGRYKCLYDSAVVIPRKIFLAGDTNHLTTHNFSETILVINRNDTLINKVLLKESFQKKLSKYFRNYGVLQRPVFLGYDAQTSTFDFMCSFKVPVEEKSKDFMVSFKKNGEMDISNL